MISVIIPIYNACKYLEECLTSIKNQTYQDYEVICVDDGSTDESGNICKTFANQDCRIKYLYQNNAGVSAARNLGLENANGNYVCFVDADDYIHNEFLYTLLEEIKENDAIVCDYTNGDGLGKKGHTTEVNVRQIILDVVYERIKHPALWCFMFKNDIIKKNNIRFTLGCIKNEDTEFYLKYLATCVRNIVMTSYVGYYYRFNPSSVMNSPITMTSFTDIEASKRINEILYEKNYIDNIEIILSSKILAYCFKTAKAGNINMYKYLHDNYEVKKAMKLVLINFPRISKKIVALAYLVLREKRFFYIIKKMYWL